jgi:hypothetical protein
VSLADRRSAPFARSDPDGLLQIEDENLAVTDLPRAGAAFDGFNGRIHEIIVHGDLQLDFPYQVTDLRVAAINLRRLALLASTPDDVGNRNHVTR